MKKIFTLSAMAIAVTITATAMEPKMTNSIENAIPLKEIKVVPQAKVTMPSTRATSLKKVSSIDDLVGNYLAKWGIWPFEGNDPYGGNCSPVISKGSAANEVIISMFPYSDVEFKGTVDLAAGTIIIPEQTCNYIPSLGENMKFVGITLVPAEQEGYFSISEGGPLTLNITETGLEAPLGGFLLKAGDSYYFGCARLDIQNIKQYIFSYNADEWAEAGTAKFTDNAFRDQYEDPTAVPSNVEVPLYVNKKDQNVLLLMNPYKCGEWPSFNPIPEADANKNGFIQFSIEDPNCVPMRPYVGSGYYFPMGTQNDPDYQETYLYNREGVMYFNGAYLEDIAGELAAAELPCSYYDDQTRTVYIYNGLFGVSSNPSASYLWRNQNNESVYLEWEFILPDLSAVNEIEVGENAPAKYYNLQGMEVKAPAAGELVIVKKGGKTYKTFAK